MSDKAIRMRNTSPCVSVLVHTFNHEAYIRQTVEGALTQATDFPVEIIVHDDCSTDDTAYIIREMAENHPERIFPLLQQENQFSQGRRPPYFSFSRARGDFIALCEGDDFWTDPRKLQRQVDALRRNPEVDLCVHPAMRLSMRTGKQKKAFDHGSRELIISPEIVIARHNQFAPTASMLMRTSSVQNLPDWFSSAPDLPVGDCFIESILGRKGILYLPQIMSTYRRGVPGSYTDRFEHSAGQDLEERLERMLYFTEKLRSMEGIPGDALDQRLSYIRLNYALQFLAMGDRVRFKTTSQQINLRRYRALPATLAAMRCSRVAFAVGRKTFQKIRGLKQ